LRLFSFGGYGLALAALALVVFGAIECPPIKAWIFTWIFNETHGDVNVWMGNVAVTGNTTGDLKEESNSRGSGESSVARFPDCAKFKRS